MSIHDVWHRLDDKMQKKFHGHFGQAAFREAVTIASMFYAHKYLKLSLDPRHHADLDRAWYGSLLPSHPLHGLRISVQEKIGNLAVAVDDYFGHPIQKKFAVFDTFVVPQIETHINQWLS